MSVLTKVSQGVQVAAANRNTAVGNVAIGLKSLVRGRLLVCSDKRPGVPWAAAGAGNVAIGACLSVLTKRRQQPGRRAAYDR